MRRAVGDPGKDCDIVGQNLAVVEHHCRHLSLRIDIEIASARVQLFGVEVDTDELECKLGFQQRDVIGKTAEVARKKTVSLIVSVIRAAITQGCALGRWSLSGFEMPLPSFCRLRTDAQAAT